MKALSYRTTTNIYPITGYPYLGHTLVNLLSANLNTNKRIKLCALLKGPRKALLKKHQRLLTGLTSKEAGVFRPDITLKIAALPEEKLSFILDQYRFFSETQFNTGENILVAELNSYWTFLFKDYLLSFSRQNFFRIFSDNPSRLWIFFEEHRHTFKCSYHRYTYDAAT